MKFCNGEGRTGQRQRLPIQIPLLKTQFFSLSLSLRTGVTGICHHPPLERFADKRLHLISPQLAMAVFTLRREIFLCMVTPQEGKAERQAGGPYVLESRIFQNETRKTLHRDTPENPIRREFCQQPCNTGQDKLLHLGERRTLCRMVMRHFHSCSSLDFGTAAKTMKQETAQIPRHSATHTKTAVNALGLTNNIVCQTEYP